MKGKIVSRLTLIFTLVFAFFINASAATITVDDNVTNIADHVGKLVTNQGSLMITNVHSNDAFAAYKVLDTYYNATSNEISYQFTDNFRAFLASINNDLTVENYKKLTSGDVTNGSTTTVSTLDTLVSKYAAYVKTNSVTGTAMTVTGTTATADVHAGSYLVLPTRTLKVYAVMVGNVEFSAVGNEWQLNNASIVAKASEASVSKNITNEGVVDNSFTKGKNINYSIVGTIPVYPTNATNKKYTIMDTLSAGLTLNNDSIKINDIAVSDGKVVDTDGNTLATVVIDGQKITVDCDLAHLAGTSVTITYSAKLNENAVLGSVGNDNIAVLTYSNDPYGTGTATTEEKDGKKTVYTYGIELLKYTGEEKTPLSGAEFKIYSDSELTKEVGSITTLENGIGQFKGLATGTYYLKETKAPSGYSLSRDTIEVTIDATNHAAGFARVEVPNKKAGLLPSTGSIGTILFTLAGASIIGGSVYYFAFYRKKHQAI